MINQLINKQLICERFRKSLNTYNSHATAQTIINNKLIELIPPSFEPKKIFEIGCGTGILSGLLEAKFSSSEFVFNDLVFESKGCFNNFKANHSFAMGDIETIDFPSNNNLIISGSALQWLTDLPMFAIKASNALTENGLLIYNTYGANNFTEISSITGSGIQYPSVEQIKNSIEDKFEILLLESENITLYFNSPLEVLKHMKNTGTNAISREKWTPSDFNNFEKEYRKLFHSNKGFSLTYNPIYIVAKKK